MDRRIVIKKYKKKGREKTYRYTMRCLYCKDEFDIMARDYNRGRGLYCSHQCSEKRMNGKGNPRWNNGRKKCNGYVYIHKSLVQKKYYYLITQHFYIPEHRLVVAKKYKRRLTKKDIVHHLNAIKTDNRSENLVIVNNRNHERHTFEKLLQKRIKELEKK